MPTNGIDYSDPIAMFTKPTRLLPNNKALAVEYLGFLLHYENRNAIVQIT